MASAYVDDLASSHYVTVIVRLVVDRRGELLRGEFAGVDAVKVASFSGWAGFTEALQSYLRGRAADLPPA